MEEHEEKDVFLPNGPINMRKAKVIVDNDRELFFELVTVFLNTYTDYIDEITKSIQTNDPKTLNFSAHRLKGALRNFAADAAVEAAYALEKKGETGSMEKVEGLFNDLVKEIEEVKLYFTSGLWEREFHT